MTERSGDTPRRRRVAFVAATRQEAARWDVALRRVQLDAVIIALSDDAESRLRDADHTVIRPEPGARCRDIGEDALADAAEAARRLDESRELALGGVNYGRLLYDRVLRELAPFYDVVRMYQRALADREVDALVTPAAVDAYYHMGAVMRESAAQDAALASGIEFVASGGFLRAARRRASALLWHIGQRLRNSRQLAMRAGDGRVTAIAEAEDVVVVSPFSGAERAALLPLVSALKARPGRTVVALESPDYHAGAGKLTSPAAGIAYAPLDSFSTRADVTEVRRVGRQVERILGQLCERGANGPFGPSGATDYVRARVPVVLGLQAAHAHMSIGATRRALEALRPRAIVVAKCRGPHMEALLEAARVARVPTAFLPHGLYVPEPSWRPPNADLILSDGPAFERVMSAAGADPSKIARVGPPKYDAFFGADRDELMRARTAELGLDPQVRHVCLAATGDVPATVEMARALAEALRADDSTSLLVKLHPRLADESIQAGIRAAAPSARLVLGGDSLALYALCDLVVTGPSTAGVEAMMVGTPVVYVGAVSDDVHGYVARKGAAHAQSASELADVVSSLLADADLRERLVTHARAYAEATFSPLDGKAAERAIAAIETLIAGAQP